MPDFVDTFFNFGSLVQVYPLLLKGFGMTLLLIVTIVPSALVLGLLIAVIYNFNIPVVRQLLIVYIDFLRSFPPLVLLIFMYSGLPFIGIRLGEFESVVLGLTANGSAFFGEIFRAGIESIPRSQRDAARSTGLNAVQTMVFVIVPQGIRNVVPALTSNIVDLAKLTALASVLSFPELLRTARLAQSIVYNPTPLIFAAIVFLALLWPLVRLLSRLELKMTVIASR